MENTIFKIIAIKNTTSGEILTEKSFCFITNIVKFYSLKDVNSPYQIHKVKRLKDNVIFCVGDNVYDDGYGHMIIEKFQYYESKPNDICVFFVNNKTEFYTLDKIINTTKINYLTEITIDDIEYTLIPKK